MDSIDHPSYPQSINTEPDAASPRIPLAGSASDELETNPYTIELLEEAQPHLLHGSRDPSRGWRSALENVWDCTVSPVAPAGIDAGIFAAAVDYIRNPETADSIAAADYGDDDSACDEPAADRPLGRDDIFLALTRLYRSNRDRTDADLLAGATPHFIAEKHGYPINAVTAYQHLFFNLDGIGSLLISRLTAFFQVIPGQRIPPEHFTPRKERLFIAIHLGLPGLRVLDGETVSPAEQRALEDKILAMEDTRGLLEAMSFTTESTPGVEL